MHKNTSDIFCLNNAEDGKQIFSISGSPSFRINRRHEIGSNVFPYGCMGNTKEICDLSTTNKVEEDIVKETECTIVPPELVEETLPPVKPNCVLPPYKGLSARNPLTGEGIELPNPNKGKKGSGRRPAKWTW